MSLFECSHCRRAFKSRNNILRHFRSLHPNEQTEEICSFTCSHCGHLFNDRSNFLKHWRKSHSHGANNLPNHQLKQTRLFECSHCGRKFNHRSNFLRHWRKSHSNDVNNLPKHQLKESHLFECSHCGRIFSHRSNFIRHWRTSHLDRVNHVSNYQIRDTRLFECFHCSRVFNRRSNFIRHCRRAHPGGIDNLSNPPLKQARSFECCHCGRIFNNRSNFLRHWRTSHLNGQNNLPNHRVKEARLFECSHCGHVFNNRSNFLRHYRLSHLNEGNNLPNRLKRAHSFECSHCGHIFNTKSSLSKHWRTFHTDDENDLSNHHQKEIRPIVGFKCVQCNCLFDKCNLLEKHYREIHNLTLEHKTLQFPSLSDFNEWKLSMERDTVVHFRIRSTWNSVNHTKRLFICHRSGFYQQKCANERRKRFLKDCGSKKIQGHCPAQMTLSVDRTTGICAVDFVPTHLGHAVRDKRELRHIYWDAEEKLKLAAKIHDSSTAQELKDYQHLPNKSEEENDLVQLLTLQDAENITQEYDDQFYAFNNDIVHLDVLDKKNKDAILFYKPQMAKDKENIFEKEDFALIFMNEDQERSLRRYGHKIICFDGAYGTNNFLLHTLMVLDVNYEEIPAAFAISNRNDQRVIDVLLRCIRDRVGIISPKCLMSDMQTMYINSWHSIMGEPEHYFYCSWHVREAWRKNLVKIKDKTKRDFISNKLDELATELNVITFEEKLHAFLLYHEKDKTDMVKKFIQYFRENYVDNGTKSYWAYCFRREAGINTNMFLESFHRKLKWGVGKGKTIEKLHDAVQILLNFLELKETEEEIKEIRGKSTQKLRKLRHGHRSADDFLQEKSIDDVVNVISENIWLVHSGNDENTSYTVKRTDTKECVQYADVVCRLACNICQICFHEYMCDCFDAIIRNNMCKHIHIVGLFLQKHQPTEMTNCCVADNQAGASVPEIVNTYPNMNQHYWMEWCHQDITDVEDVKDIEDIEEVEEVEEIEDVEDVEDVEFEIKEQKFDESDNKMPFSRYQEAKQTALEILEKALTQTQDPEVIQELTKKYIVPIETIVRTMNVQGEKNLFL